jgi:hypothetical protein
MVQAGTEHVEIRYRFPRQAVKSRKVKVICCPTELMLDDALTKALCKDKLAKFAISIQNQDT